MFSKKQADSDSPPPTLAALKEKISRAYYIILQWNSAHINLPSLPDPNDYDWLFNEKDQVFEPQIAPLPPTPEFIIHLTVCNCKTNCSTNRCKCRKNGLDCSEMCKCENRENDEEDKEMFHESQATLNFVHLLRTSVIQLISIISNYSIHQMLFKKFLHNFQITNHFICNLFNSCMTLMEFIALY